jgi:hypothetical protein
MAAPVLQVVKLMERHTAARLTGLVEMILGLVNPESGGGRWEVHPHPQPCLKCGARQGRKEGKDCDVQTGIIQFEVVRNECDIRRRFNRTPNPV